MSAHAQSLAPAAGRRHVSVSDGGVAVRGLPVNIVASSLASRPPPAAARPPDFFFFLRGPQLAVVK